MKILDDWKVYSGVSDLKQHAEGIPVSQVIINSNYSDDHDDYDIALMKLSRPLTLSGEVSGLAVPLDWAGTGVQGLQESLGMGRSKRRLRSPWGRPLGCMGLLPAGASRSAVATLPVPWPGTAPPAGLGCVASVAWRGASRAPARVGAEGSVSCAPRSSLATGLVTTEAILLPGDSSFSPRLLFIMSPSSSGSPSLPPHARPAIPDRQVLLHHRLWEDQGERR